MGATESQRLVLKKIKLVAEQDVLDRHRSLQEGPVVADNVLDIQLAQQDN
jgi:hypothetical protein